MIHLRRESPINNVEAIADLWRDKQVTPSDLMKQACTPGGFSSEVVFTLERYAFRAGIMEVIQKGREKADQFN
jgi:pyrroline-5-carboxylate reductase